MNKKYFGEFLVERGVISVESLVNALMFQIASQPPICQIALELGLLKHDDLFRIFRYQQESNADFFSACKKLGYWDENMARKINDEIDRVRIPLGEILLKRGDLELKTLTQMLDEFLSRVEPVTENTIESEQVGKIFLLELEDIFDERKKKVLKVALSFIKDKSSTDEKVILKLFQDCFKISHTINGLVKMFGIKYLSSVLSFSEELLEKHLMSNQGISEHQKVAQMLYEAFDLAWDLRASILETKNEEAFMSFSDQRERYEKVLGNLKTLAGVAA